MTDVGKPFLKWPGGKRWLVPIVRNLVKDVRYERYVEPFLGGGAVFFGLAPTKALLSDINADLVNTYEQVAAQPDELITRLRSLNVDQQTYNRIRRLNARTPLTRAVRFLYLNRTAFGGIYRLNRRGEFNVPFGGGNRTPAPLWHANLLANASASLLGATLRTADFETVLKDTGEGDLVYCDPTYTVTHNNNGFIRYNEKNFAWNDQLRLARAARQAAHRGATVFVSNAHHKDILALYNGAELHQLTRRSLLCPTPAKRTTTDESLMILRPLS